MDYTLKEMMTIAAARKITDKDIVFCGTGISMLAAVAAKHTNAPHCILFFETGAVDSLLQELPLAVSDSRVMHGASLYCSLHEAFSFLQNPGSGRRVVGIVGAAQIDRFGNLNATCLGGYDRPDVRFPGSGGACDMASFAGRIIIFMTLEKRKFVEKLDYLTSPGWLSGPGSREKAGLRPTGPSCVVTDKGTMGFDAASREMFLEGVYKGVSPSEIQEQVEFPLDVSRARKIRPPGDEELKVLREKADPERLILD